MESIKISLTEVKDLATQIRSINQKMKDALESAHQQMKGLQSVWDSKGSREIIDRFNRFSSRFEASYETVENYAAFLDRTVSSYDSLEETIRANANNFS